MEEDNAKEEHVQLPDEDLIDERLHQQFEEEANGTVIRDAAMIKVETIRGDQTQPIS